MWTVEGSPQLSFMHLLLVKNACCIKDSLKAVSAPDFPFQGFFWNKTEDAWTVKIKKHKQWSLAFEKVMEFADLESSGVADERGQWLPMQKLISIHSGQQSGMAPDLWRNFHVS